jgi:hypothetical protein
MDGPQLRLGQGRAPRMRASRRSPSRSVTTIRRSLRPSGRPRASPRRCRPTGGSAAHRPCAAQADPVGIGERRLRTGAEVGARLVPFEPLRLVPNAGDHAGIGPWVALIERAQARREVGTRVRPAHGIAFGESAARRAEPGPAPRTRWPSRGCSGRRTSSRPCPVMRPSSSSAPSAVSSVARLCQSLLWRRREKPQPLRPPHCASSSARPARSATSISAGAKAGRAPSCPRVQSR